MWGIRGAKVELDGNCVRALRVLVVPERSVDDTLRDVSRLVRTVVGGRELDASKIEILTAGDDLALMGRTRRRLTTVGVERSREGFTVRIGLELAGDVLMGEDHCAAGRPFELRAVVRATLQACKELLVVPVELDQVIVKDLGVLRYALVSLSVGREVLAGSAVVRLDEHDAVARATLDALNRVLGEVPASATHLQ